MSIAKLTPEQWFLYRDVIERLEEIRQKPIDALTPDDHEYAKTWLHIFDVLTGDESESAVAPPDFPCHQ